MLKTIVTNEYQDSNIICKSIIDIGISFLKSINSFHTSSDRASGWSTLLYGMMSAQVGKTMLNVYSGLGWDVVSMA